MCVVENIIDIIVILALCAIAWVIGVHSPWWLLLILYVVGFIRAIRTEGLEGVKEFIFMSAFILISGIIALLYGDFNVDWLNIKYLFTGE